MEVSNSPAEEKTQAEAEPHCDICLEIHKGCIEDAKSEVKCPVCDRKGYINLESGAALVCSSCQRGFRLKLRVKHEGLLENAVLLLDLPIPYAS